MSYYLPDGVMMDILARLPAKSVVQFRCVCKSWYSLINGHYFSTLWQNHKTHINTTHLLVIGSEYERQQRISLYVDNNQSLTLTLTPYHFNLQSIVPVPKIYSFVRCLGIVGSCNGLVCLVDNICTTSTPLYLCNPTIQKFVRLPPPNNVPHDSISHPIFVEMNRVLGYGFDSTTNDYKVVKIVYNKGGGAEVEIYSLKECRWRNIINVSAHLHYINRHSSHAFLHGAIHWVAGHDSYRPGDPQDPLFIVLFNLGSEVFSEMKLPKCLHSKKRAQMSPGLFQDSLCLFDNDSYRGKSSIWVMERYSDVESWTKRYSFDHGNSFMKVIGLRRNGEVLFIKDKEMVSVDIKTRRHENVGMPGYDAPFCVQTYTESLALIDKQNGSCMDQR